MSAVAQQSEIRLARLLDEQVMNQQLHENLVAAIEGSDDKVPTESQTEQIKMYREKSVSLNEEITQLADTVEEHRRATEASKQIRRALATSGDGVEVDGDGIVYRDFNAYAFDYFITRVNVPEAVKIARQWGVNDEEVMAARQRLDLVKRTPANTLSSNVGGLTPPQHINQIFQKIDKSRPLVNSAQRDDLVRGQLTYPVITTKPVVAVQGTQKTEAGNTGMVVDMVTATASTYLGGGDLSWQAINWSTPSALRLWFDLVAADYALKTEQDAAQAMQHSAFTYNAATLLSSTPTFAQFMTSVGSGYAEVFTNSARIPDTIYLAPDRFGYILGTTSDAFAQFATVGQSGVGPLNIVISRGMDAGVIVVGDSSALLVAETPGAPVEMQVVEPAIGGVEVGLIGAFEAVVTDPGAFAMITTAS
jgi:hypothetical protein